MNSLVQSNIKKSLKIIVEDKPSIPDNLIKIINKEQISTRFSLLILMAKNAVTPIPWFFYTSHDELSSPQQSFFGFYCIRNIIRGIFLSLRFIQGGDLLFKNNFLALSVSSYYTASFHLLQAFLALHGLVIVEQILGPSKIEIKENSSSMGHNKLKDNIDLIMAKLQKGNTWKFEPRSRSHSRRWNELQQIFSSNKYDIPDFFISFFEYLCSCDGMLLTNNGNIIDNEKTLIQVGIEQLTNIRHEAIYCGYGYDDDVYINLINRDTTSMQGIDARADAYRKFAVNLMEYCINDCIVILKKISCKYWTEINCILNVSIKTPDFEIREILLPEDEITEKLKFIYKIFFQIR